MRPEKFSSLRAVKIRAENLEKKFRALRKLQPLKNHDIKKATGGKLESTTYKRLPTLVERLNIKENCCSTSCTKKSSCENCLKAHNFVEDKSVSAYRDKKVRELLSNFNRRCLRGSKAKKANNNCKKEKSENNQISTSFKTISNYINSYSDPREIAVSTLKKFQRLADDDDFFSQLQRAQNTSKKSSRKFKYQKLNKKVTLPPIRQEPLKKTAKVPTVPANSKVNIRTSEASFDRFIKVQQPNVTKALEDKTVLQSKRNLPVLPRLRKNSSKRVSTVSSYYITNKWEDFSTMKPKHEVLPDINSKFSSGEKL